MVRPSKKWHTKSPAKLRAEAMWAYLDNRVAFAKALNKLADEIEFRPAIVAAARAALAEAGAS